MKTCNKYPPIICLLAGAALALAFAPVGWWPLAILAPAALLTCWQSCTPKQAAWRGWWFGLGLFGIGVSWVFISIHRFGGTNIVLAGFITAAFIAFLALFPALLGYILQRLYPKPTVFKLLCAFPAWWVLLEWLRSWLFTGFPWLFIGYTAIDTPLAGYAPIIGVYGLSFLLALQASIVVLAKRKPLWCALLTIVIWTGGYALQQQHWTKATGEPINVSLVQANIPQSVKWDPAQVDNTLQRYTSMTRPLNSDLVVWPEGAIPVPRPLSQSFFDDWQTGLQQENRTLITGVPYALDNYSKFYNSVYMLGAHQGEYRKRHLVPFGEYVPFENLLRGLIGLFDIPMSDFISGQTQQAPLRYGDIHILPTICYEIAYPRLIISQAANSNIILTVSENSWFGDSLELGQMLQMARMRSLETGRPQLMATNDGITAFIDAQGHVYEQAPKFTPTVLTSTIQPTTGLTPILRMGLSPLLLLLLVLACTGVMFNNKSRKINN